MNEKRVSPDVEYTKEDILPPWIELESAMIYAESPDFLVVTKRIDWEKVPLARSMSLPPSQPARLIKYSEAQWSPVSSFRAKNIQLATPSVYRNLNPDKNSEFIADELDSAFVADLDWTKKQYVTVERLKTQLRESSFGFRQAKVSVTLSLPRPEYWMYCAAIAPETSSGMKIQRDSLSLNYDFMTGINNPANFARQLGIDLGLQKGFKNSVTCDYPGLFSITSSITKNYIVDTLKSARTIGGISESGKKSFTNAISQLKAIPEPYVIHVTHGVVAYLKKDRIASCMAEIPEIHGAAIIPFVKQIDYADQQEYRFVISVQFHRPRIDKFYLDVSDELRSLITPMGTIPHGL